MTRASRFPSCLLTFLLVELAACTADTAAPPTVLPELAVEVVEYGEAGTTVVFESGLGDDWMPWERVAREVGAHARAFTYSRPGYGRSEPTPRPRDAEHIVEDLRALLAARKLAPPYVLVGHSLGGAYMELFAKAHPEDVRGVVLVDPRHRDFTRACEEAGIEGCTVPASVVATLPQVQVDELEAFDRSAEQIGEYGGFGAYPVRVLTATAHGFVPEAEMLWQSLLGALADEAVDGERIVIEGAGHYLQQERARDVVEAIIGVLPAPRVQGS